MYKQSKNFSKKLLIKQTIIPSNKCRMDKDLVDFFSSTRELRHHILLQQNFKIRKIPNVWRASEATRCSRHVPSQKTGSYPARPEVKLSDWLLRSGVKFSPRNENCLAGKV